MASAAGDVCGSGRRLGGICPALCVLVQPQPLGGLRTSRLVDGIRPQPVWRDSALSGAVVLAPSVGAGLRVASGSDRKRCCAGHSGDWRAGGDNRLCSDSLAEMGFLGSMVFSDFGADIQRHAASRSGFRTPHVSAVGGGGGGRRGGRMGCGPMACPSGDNSLAGVAGRRRLAGDVRKYRTGISHFPAERRLPERDCHVGRHGGQGPSQRAGPIQPRLRLGQPRSVR